MPRYPAFAATFALIWGTNLYSAVLLAPAFSSNDDLVKPGLSAVTVTPGPSSSMVRPFENDNTYDFVA